MAVARGDTEWADVAVAAIFPYAGRTSRDQTRICSADLLTV